jgi:hypothetical protein
MQWLYKFPELLSTNKQSIFQKKLKLLIHANIYGMLHFPTVIITPILSVHVDKNAASPLNKIENYSHFQDQEYVPDNATD